MSKNQSARNRNSRNRYPFSHFNGHKMFIFIFFFFFADITIRATSLKSPLLALKSRTSVRGGKKESPLGGGEEMLDDDESLYSVCWGKDAGGKECFF